MCSWQDCNSGCGLFGVVDFLVEGEMDEDCEFELLLVTCCGLEVFFNSNSLTISITWKHFAWSSMNDVFFLSRTLRYCFNLESLCTMVAVIVYPPTNNNFERLDCVHLICICWVGGFLEYVILVWVYQCSVVQEWLLLD